MTKKERIQAVLRGEHPDHPPVSFWYHFPPEMARGQPSVDAHIRHLEDYDLDFLKVMNDYQYPRGEVEVVTSAEDLHKVKPQSLEVEDFAGQLDVLQRLRQQVGDDLLMTTTLFNPWAILRKLVEPPSDRHGPPKLMAEDERDDAVTRLIAEDRSAVKAALDAIGETLADFARACIQSGADGIFLSVRDDWVNRSANGPDTYDELLREVDLEILQAATAGTFNMLHICGRPLDFEAFTKYPAHVVNWADRSAGPSIAYARDRVKAAIAGGVDNLKTLPEGTPQDCTAEVLDALRQAKNRPILITPGCTFDGTKVPRENLQAVVQAARNDKR